VRSDQCSLALTCSRVQKQKGKKERARTKSKPSLEAPVGLISRVLSSHFQHP
jgi:hypothetical protein